jgi:hypothetical protein
VKVVYPCLGCGFLVLSEPVGSYGTCPVCGWEDDPVQAADSEYQGGANGISLADHQYGVLQRFPLTVREHLGLHRDPGWRPVGSGV